MTDKPKSPNDESFEWGPGSEHKVPAGSGDAETYQIPGGLGGWEPGQTPPPNSDGTIRKTPPRDEPKPPGAVTSRRKPPSMPPRTWELLGFNLLVFVSSVCVMTLELTASRLISKHVGSSLYTWTSVIGVVLAGITIGNSLGGWLADRFSRPRTLAWMFLFSSISCASVLWLDQMVGRMSRPDMFSLPMWVLTVVASMFLVPALFLGTTSPLVASMALERSTRTGTTVGNVYAWGAFGSIIGTFFTGFYLIDVWGTRAIVGITAAVLAMLAIIVSSQRWVFRTAVLVGWMQLLGFLWIAATITSPTSEALASRAGMVLALGDSEARSVHNWADFGNRCGEKLHELGLILRLRDDQLGAYHDESQYSYIQVRDDYVDGSPVKALRLDKLDHSYFDPAEPTKLHYEYEQVYAAITHRAAPEAPQQTTVSVPDFPGREQILSALPEGVTFDKAAGILRVPSTEPALLEALLALSPEAPFWQAVDDLRRETIRPRWGGFSTVELETLPDGIEIPDSMRFKISYDVNLEALSAYEVLTEDDAARLYALGQQSAWRTAISELQQRTAALNTLFIGGGGFIFPRWILKEFPASDRVDVAELDPAVYKAVREELGLTDAEDERITTFIGDARNFVDDRHRANQRLVKVGKPPVQYDFIYGDAFNDFSVPWHLTTREFTQKVHDLLKDDGLLLANIIEIYPRIELPGGTVPAATARLLSKAPANLFDPPLPGSPRKVRRALQPVECDGSTLSITGPMTAELEEQLLQLDTEDGDWLVAVSELAERSRGRRPLPIPLPEALRPTLLYELNWTASPEPFAGVEVYRLNDDQHVLGLRGVVPAGLEQRLIGLQPGNAEWKSLIETAAARSRKPEAGRFLGRYVHTMTKIFPYVAVFCTSDSQPSDGRDTFVVACGKRPHDLKEMVGFGSWVIKPFAEFEQKTPTSTPEYRGQMESILGLAENQVLTDDYAPVDNLLRAVFVDQDR